MSFSREERKRLAVIKKLRRSGVCIPCADGIIVEETVTVGKGTLILPGCILRGSTVIGENVRLEKDCFIEDTSVGNGSVLRAVYAYSSSIGEGVTAGPFTHIRPGSVIADGVHLGNFVEVKNSNVGKGTKIAHLTYVGDSDVGERVNFGCGTVTVNYDGKTKARTVIKDGAFIGCNTNLIAPVTVGENAYTAAGTTVTEDVPDGALSIGRARQTNKENWQKK